MPFYTSNAQFDEKLDSIPTHGASQPDAEAVGKEALSVAEWRKREEIDVSRQVKLVKLAHMRYQHPDFLKITTFLRDFGMKVVKQTDDKIWFCGYGVDQYVYYAQRGPKKFLGGAFEVESYQDLEKAAQIPGASQIEALTDAPGGGFNVTLRDPEGFPVNLIYGQTPVEPGKVPENLVLNFENEKKRLRSFQRFQLGPAAVHKLGHYGLCTQSFQDQVHFYTRTFNLVPTDFLYVEDLREGTKKNVAMFAHIDRGTDYVDHHTFFLSANDTCHVHHCSFEVHDFDTQHIGHQWLAKKGYESVWGVGRHVLGSQIFDYWWDTTGNMVEHYADGDQINEQTPIGWGPAGDESLAVWGPEVPAWFLK